MGHGKNKNCASKLDRFLLFFCQSQLAGIIRSNRGYPWLLFLSSRAAPVGCRKLSLVNPLLLQSPMTSLLLPRNPTRSEQTIRRRSAEWFALTTRTKSL
jgi:hypothetical protein